MRNEIDQTKTIVDFSHFLDRRVTAVLSGRDKDHQITELVQVIRLLIVEVGALKLMGMRATFQVENPSK